jgi:hypothetical protein
MRRLVSLNLHRYTEGDFTATTSEIYKALDALGGKVLEVGGWIPLSFLAFWLVLLSHTHTHFSLHVIL